MSEPKGRVLRVKQGYNPNSSSLGTIIFAFPSAMLAAPIVFSAVAGMICSKCLHDAPTPHGALRSEADREDADQGQADIHDSGS